MQLSLTDAMVRIASAVSPWSIVYGPAAALVCTTNRLGWSIRDATSMTTDDSREVDLLADPPVVVKRLVEKSVRSWRWRNMAAAHPSLPKEGANFGPIYKLMGSKRNDEKWNPRLIGALKSVLANRQYAQQRCMAVGWVAHGKCIFCLHATVTGQTLKAVLPEFQKTAASSEVAKQRKTSKGPWKG